MMSISAVCVCLCVCGVCICILESPIMPVFFCRTTGGQYAEADGRWWTTCAVEGCWLGVSYYRGILSTNNIPMSHPFRSLDQLSEHCKTEHKIVIFVMRQLPQPKLHPTGASKGLYPKIPGRFLTVIARETTNLPQMYNFVSPVSKKPWRRVHTQQSCLLRYMARTGPFFSSTRKNQ